MILPIMITTIIIVVRLLGRITESLQQQIFTFFKRKTNQTNKDIRSNFSRIISIKCIFNVCYLLNFNQSFVLFSLKKKKEETYMWINIHLTTNDWITAKMIWKERLVNTNIWERSVHVFIAQANIFIWGETFDGNIKYFFYSRWNN